VSRWNEAFVSVVTEFTVVRLTSVSEDYVRIMFGGILPAFQRIMLVRIMFGGTLPAFQRIVLVRIMFSGTLPVRGSC
jgi:hypothetical protein